MYDQREYERKVGVHDQLFLFEAQRLGFQGAASWGCVVWSFA